MRDCAMQEVIALDGATCKQEQGLKLEKRRCRVKSSHASVLNLDAVSNTLEASVLAVRRCVASLPFRLTVCHHIQSRNKYGRFKLNLAYLFICSLTRPRGVFIITVILELAAGNPIGLLWQ